MLQAHHPSVLSFIQRSMDRIRGTETEIKWGEKVPTGCECLLTLDRQQFCYQLADTHIHTHTHTRHNRCHLSGAEQQRNLEVSERGRFSEPPLYISVLLYDTCCRYLLSQTLTGLVPVSSNSHLTVPPSDKALRVRECVPLSLSPIFSLVACFCPSVSLCLFISPIHHFPSHPEGTQHGHNWPI